MQIPEGETADLGGFRQGLFHLVLGSCRLHAEEKVSGRNHIFSVGSATAEKKRFSRLSVRRCPSASPRSTEASSNNDCR